MSGSLKGTVGALSPEYTSGLIRADFSSPIHHNKGFMVVEGMDDVSFYGRYVIPNVKIYPPSSSTAQAVLFMQYFTICSLPSQTLRNSLSSFSLSMFLSPCYAGDCPRLIVQM